MNVLHLNTYVTEGGAARICGNLHEALRAAGRQSRIVALERVEGREDVRNWVPPGLPWRLAQLGTRWLEKKCGLDGLVDVTCWAGYRRHARWADVIHLHNLHTYYFSLFLLPRLEKAAPLLWNLHDMWPLTGHCYHAFDCERWLEGCGRCPRPEGPPPIGLNASALLYRARERVYAKINPVLVVPSRWLADQVGRSPLMQRFRAVCIPHGIDTEGFRPVDTAAAREVLGISTDEKVILYGAHVLRGPGKGADLLVEALARLEAEDLGEVRVVLMGHGAEEIARRVHFPVLKFPWIGNDRLLRALYCAADVFVSTSRAETFGLTLVESMACGTPVVAFRTTAIPEVVKDGQTGLLAEPFDTADLAERILQVLTDDDLRRRLSQEGRAAVERDYTIDRMTGSYFSLYEEVLEQRRSSGRRSP